MHLDALVTSGRLPWSPNPEARDLQVWYEYEHPYVGTFTVGDVTVLFNVLGGVETEMTVWTYTCLEPEEASDLADVSFASVPELRTFVQRLLSGRQLVFALADDLIINSWAVSEVEGDVYEAATTFLENVFAQTRGKLTADTRFRAQLAQVDVATHNLVQA
jgi:hypothetical protein